MMRKIILVFILSIIYLSISVSSSQYTSKNPCIEDCENENMVDINFPNENIVDYLREMNWLIVKYTDGRFYYHNLETRYDTWDYPLDTCPI
tara:strand:+ start:63 stop:335 length:273 start_codon:yes stop_codon:yes gene_type:complete